MSETQEQAQNDEARGWRARGARWASWTLRALPVLYIAAIGVFAIEELQRRERLLGIFAARETEVAAALAGLADAQPSAKREALETERARLKELRTRLTALVVGGAGDVATPAKQPNGTVKQLLCEWTVIHHAETVCAPRIVAWYEPRELAATLALKRAAETRSSGDVFAVLIVVAAVGGALVRLHLRKDDDEDAFRPVMRAVGGGIVCYLVLSGGALPLGTPSVPAVTNPATASLFGFLCGMFSTRVFKLVSAIVDSWIDKLTPAPRPQPPAAATPNPAPAGAPLERSSRSAPPSGNGAAAAGEPAQPSEP